MLIPEPRSLRRHDDQLGAFLFAELRYEIVPELGPESYSLTTVATAANGGVPQARAGDAAGLARARASLTQLALHADGGRYPAVTVEDSPRYRHRGLMLDLARHFHPLGTVLTVLDLMAELKLNVLHLHLSDDQGWRLDFPELPDLARMGGATDCSGGTGGYLTSGDYRTIQDHASRLHITVIPEIDLPGHINAALVAYPDLAPRGTTIEPYTGMEVGFSQLDVHQEASYEFVTRVLTRLAELTDGPYLHIGGDECLAMPEEDHLHFMQRLTAIVAATGKTLVGWHEIGQSPALRPGTIGQYWNFTTPVTPEVDRFGIDHAARATAVVEQGGELVMSPSDVAYFDMIYAPGDTVGVDWIERPTTLAHSYEWEPAAILPQVSDAVVGVEATCFTETIATRDQLLTMLLPRLVATAEIAWSPRPARPRRVEDLLPRLRVLARDWQERGIPFRADAIRESSEPEAHDGEARLRPDIVPEPAPTS